MRAKDAVGRYGERVAARLLVEAGMAVLETNWRCRSGEVDIVARDGDCLVLCEVKTRRSGRAGSALEAVTPRKVGRLRGLAAEWLKAHPGVHPPRVRLDVVAVTVAERGPARVEHVRGVG
ncbi:YraN family protein [Kineococcus sp. T13]|uniref:YraN family protein n=1 Tax=Kineococcus vitellinus TaxID=2696565 RepID=UPI001412D4CE|nr:YraN family protein [Kineococcus vitellinus]